MLTLIEIYVIGMCVAFVMAIILRFIEALKRRTTMGITALLLSWLQCVHLELQTRL